MKTSQISLAICVGVAGALATRKITGRRRIDEPEVSVRMNDTLVYGYGGGSQTARDGVRPISEMLVAAKAILDGKRENKRKESRLFITI